MKISYKKNWKYLTGQILLILLLSPAIAQSQDCIFVHLDKSFYVAGETLWFKAYLISDSGAIKSKVLYLDLISHQNNTIATQKLLINNQSSLGSIVLPMDAEEGNYSLRAYTHYNLNFDPTFIYQKTIPVYQPTKNDYMLSDKIQSGNPQPSDAHEISIAFDKSVYKPRDSVKVSFRINGIDGPKPISLHSVSVVPLDIANLDLDTNPSQCIQGDLSRDQPIMLERSLSLQGKLLDLDTKSESESKLITIYMDKSPQLIKTFADKGEIKIPVYDYWGTGVFQIMNLDPYDPSEFEFIPDTTRKFNLPYRNSKMPVRSPVVIKYIEQFEKRRKIRGLFDQDKSSEIIYSEATEMIPDAVYRTEDYKEIYSFEEFINEAIWNVKVKSVNELKTIKLFNKEMGDPFPSHPWYIVDGFITFNEKEVLDIQYQDIIEVRLYSKTSTVEKYFKHFMWNSGVFEIITRDVKHVRRLKSNPNVVQIEGFALAQNFDNTFTLSQSRTTPDLRGVIYWAPNVFTNKQGLGQLTIPLSDDTGKFAIVVKGTSDSNRLITGFSIFEVKTK